MQQATTKYQTDKRSPDLASKIIYFGHFLKH